jgi:hypothetical protein
MAFISAAFRILVGLVFGGLAAVALSPAIAAFNENAESKAPLFIPVVVLLTAVATFFAPSVRRAFGRGFLISGVSFLSLPISVMLIAWRTTSDAVIASAPGNEAVAAVGVGVAGMMATGFATFVGLIAGAIFLIIGLVLALGGRREVIIIKQSEIK